MKIFTLLFVLMIGLTAATELKAQETPSTEVSAVSNILGTPRVGISYSNVFEYQFYINTPNVDIPANDVVLTVTLPVNFGYMYGDSSCTKTNPTIEQTIVTCNLGTVFKHPIDYSKFLRIYLFPQVAGNAVITSTIKGSNTPEYTFTKTVTVLPEKSRKRIRFF